MFHEPDRRLSLVIFDLDGTLVDSRRDIAGSVNHMLSAYGLPTLPIEKIETHIGGGAENLVRRSMGAEAGRFDIPEAIRVFRAHYLEHCLDTTRDFPGIRALVSRLKARGLRLAVITNKPSSMAKRILDGLGMLGSFDLVLGGDDVPVMKPDPGPARTVFAATGAGAPAAIMVGDSAIDTEFARAAGMASVIVGYGGISGAAEVASAGADHLCRTPQDLADFLDRIVQ